jgi:hypothetical protein
MAMPGQRSATRFDCRSNGKLTRPGDGGKLDGSGETLVTLGIVVLEADLELDGLEEVSLLGLIGVLKELLDVGTDAGNRDFRHFG